MEVAPTLHFAGQCEKAIQVYREAFGLRVNFLLHYGDADVRAGLPRLRQGGGLCWRTRWGL